MRYMAAFGGQFFCPSGMGGYEKGNDKYLEYASTLLCLVPHITLAVVFWGPQGNCLAEWLFLFDIIQILWDTPTYGCQRQPIYFIFQVWKVMQKGAIQNDIPKRWEIGWQSQPYEQVTKGEKNQKKIGMP